MFGNNPILTPEFSSIILLIIHHAPPHSPVTQILAPGYYDPKYNNFFP